MPESKNPTKLLSPEHVRGIAAAFRCGHEPGTFAVKIVDHVAAQNELIQEMVSGLQVIAHSMTMALVPGNDKVRELQGSQKLVQALLKRVAEGSQE